MSEGGEKSQAKIPEIRAFLIVRLLFLKPFFVNRQGTKSAKAFPHKDTCVMIIFLV